jgi:altronate dehydratase
MQQALLMNNADNVMLAVADLPAGVTVNVGETAVVLGEDIPSGHKFAREAIAAGELIIKYGQPVGRATSGIAQGGHVHVHNVESLRGRGDLEQDSRSPKDLGSLSAPIKSFGSPSDLRGLDLADFTFMGYRRGNGRVGVRNHVMVLSAVQCANGVVRRIAQLVPEVVPVTHVYGCGQLGDDHQQTQRVLEEFAQHPNVGAVLLVGLGCETLPTTAIGERLAQGGTLIQRLTIQEQGGSKSTVERGVAVARELLAEAGRARREPVPLSELTIGLECGGSDAWSGITANPAVGAASDLVVASGGTVILSEVPETIGAEHLLEARTTPEIAEQLWAATAAWEAEARRMGVDMRGAQPTPGNIAGGLTTIEEKSLGAVSKGGSTPVREFIGYAHRPTQRGLVIMDTAGQDAESVTGMVAGGAQVVVFTTGRGSPIGCPIAPVIKVASNSEMYRRLSDDMDVDAGTIVESGESVSEVGRRIFDRIIVAANGEQTAAEMWGLGEFAISILGRRM